MEKSLLIELIHRTRATFSTISKLTQLARGKFENIDFGDFFFKAVIREIERQNLLLDTFLKYIESTTPVLKRDTVNRLIEEALKKQPRLEEKIQISKKYDPDLPETTVPDEPLQFIFDTLLQYAMREVPSGGYLFIITRVADTPAGIMERRGRESFKGDGKQVEITIAFTKSEKPGEPSEKGTTVPPPQEGVLSDLIYRLVDEVVKRNQGTITFQVDERESRNSIVLKFPAERRRTVSYPSGNQGMGEKDPRLP